MKFKTAAVKMNKAPLVVASVVSERDLHRAAGDSNPVWDMVEIRYDLIAPRKETWLEACRALAKHGIPVLLTIRSAREKGAWKGTERQRVDLYRKYLPWVSAVDVEILSPAFEPVCRAAHSLKKKVVGSFHDFERTPRENKLRTMLLRARRQGADISKLATMIQTPDDVAVLYRLLKERSRGPLCLIGMGALGRSTRLGLPSLGSCLAYGHIGSDAAPGQWHCRDLRRWLELSS